MRLKLFLSSASLTPTQSDTRSGVSPSGLKGVWTEGGQGRLDLLWFRAAVLKLKHSS